MQRVERSADDAVAQAREPPVRPVLCSFMYSRRTSMNSTSASFARTPAPPGRGERASASA
jgi:hypothetical protein